jgi:hypothetical protein
VEVSSSDESGSSTIIIRGKIKAKAGAVAKLKKAKVVAAKSVPPAPVMMEADDQLLQSVSRSKQKQKGPQKQIMKQATERNKKSWLPNLCHWLQ